MSDHDKDPGDFDEGDEGVRRTVSRKAAIKDDEPGRKTKEEQDEEAREAERRARDNPTPGVPQVEGAEAEEPDEKKGADKDKDEGRGESADRARRRRQREAKERDKKRIADLEATNGQLIQRLEKLEKGQTDTDRARLGDTLENTKAALADLRARRKQAIKDMDPDAIDALDDGIYKLRRQEENLESLARKAAAEPKKADEERRASSQPRLTEEDRASADAVANFMEDHDWIQIRDGEGVDRDSRKALAIDREMWKEGWRPTDADWEAELKDRLKAALPHRFDDPGDEGETRREPRRGPPTGGRGREGTSRGSGAIQFKLTPLHHQLLSEAGLTKSDPEARRIIKKWAEEHEAQARR